MPFALFHPVHPEILCILILTFTAFPIRLENWRAEVGEIRVLGHKGRKVTKGHEGES